MEKAARNTPSSVSYEPLLMDLLKDPAACAGYLNSCIDGDSDEDFEVFMAALEDVVKALGVSSVAVKSKMTRDALYKAFSNHRNPTVKTLRNVLHSLDMKIAVVPRQG